VTKRLKASRNIFKPLIWTARRRKKPRKTKKTKMTGKREAAKVKEVKETKMRRAKFRRKKGPGRPSTELRSSPASKSEVT
jgi:hypothetical protein